MTCRVKKRIEISGPKGLTGMTEAGIIFGNRQSAIGNRQSVVFPAGPERKEGPKAHFAHFLMGGMRLWAFFSFWLHRTNFKKGYGKYGKNKKIIHMAAGVYAERFPSAGDRACGG